MKASTALGGIFLLYFCAELGGPGVAYWIGYLIVVYLMLRLLARLSRPAAPPVDPRTKQAVPVQRPRVGRWFVGLTLPILGPLRVGVYRRVGR